MMRIFRSRWLWGVLGVSAGVWAYMRMVAGRKARQGSMQQSRAMWRRSARAARAMRPTALHMAAKAGRAMMDTTMRTVRAMNRG